MAKIKQVPEDFVVKEITAIKPDTGDYSYFWLKKRNFTTLDAIFEIAQILRVPKKNFGFAGSKVAAARPRAPSGHCGQSVASSRRGEGPMTGVKSES